MRIVRKKRKSPSKERMKFRETPWFPLIFFVVLVGLDILALAQSNLIYAVLGLIVSLASVCFFIFDVLRYCIED